MTEHPLPTDKFPRLRTFLRADRPAASRQDSVDDACELCSAPLMQPHRHLLEMSSRSVVCACNACALLFHNVVDGRFKLIPRDARILSDFSMTDVQWESLSVPINLVFIVNDSLQEKRTALYPSPAGVTESLLPLEAWDDIAAANPSLDELQDDVEALLINRLNPDPLYLAAPIDACYELAGIVRVHWRGFSGGDEVWKHVGEFFKRLGKKARHA